MLAKMHLRTFVGKCRWMSWTGKDSPFTLLSFVDPAVGVCDGRMLTIQSNGTEKRKYERSDKERNSPTGCKSWCGTGVVMQGCKRLNNVGEKIRFRPIVFSSKNRGLCCGTNAFPQKLTVEARCSARSGMFL